MASGARWRDAMAAALYGPAGFFVSGGPGPAGAFRTSVHASPLFAGAVLRLLTDVDAALGQPAALDIVDVGAGRGELLRALTGLAPATLAARLRPLAVERAPRPADLPHEIAWTDALPESVTGLLLATEWLDNVPLDAAVPGPAGVAHYVLVDPATGDETVGDPVEPADAAWLDRWWPLPADPFALLPYRKRLWPLGVSHREAEQSENDACPVVGARAEIGLPRDEAWAAAVSTLRQGLALAVDYGHLRADRPPGGTLGAFRAGRQVAPVPDGSCDVTAHVALDAVAEAGGRPYTLMTQRAALRALGIDGGRPPVALAATDPAGYVRALAAASAAAELTDPASLGGHHWLLHPRGIDLPPPLRRGTMPA